MLRKARLEVTPQKHKIAFQSYPDYSDNAAALCDYILENEDMSKIEIHWFVQNIKAPVPEKYQGRVQVHDARVRCGDYCEEAVRAAYSCGIIFFTHDFLLRSADRKIEQLVVCLWHGCGVKAAGEEKAPAAFDYLTITGPAFFNIHGPIFRVEKDKMLPLGYPRNDIIKNGNQKAKDYVKSIASDNEKIIVWMPTFRKSTLTDCEEAKCIHSGDLPLVEGVENLHKIDEICGKEGIVLLIKRHPFQPKYSEESEAFSNIKFISSEDLKSEGVDLYALLHETSGLISDYSSVATDYMLLDKPMFKSNTSFSKKQISRYYKEAIHSLKKDQMFIMKNGGIKDRFVAIMINCCPLLYCKSYYLAEKYIKGVNKSKAFQ